MGIQVQDIAFVRFRAPDLDLMEAYLTAFGLVRAERTKEALYMRGSDDEPFVHVTRLGPPGFDGLGFLAGSEAELEALAGEEGASAIEAADEPGGGHRVRFSDPDGFPVEVVAGRESVGDLTVRSLPPFNTGAEKRRTSAHKRVEAGPAQVKRLGHCVLNVTDFRQSETWYKQRFGLLTSDEIALNGETVLGAFLRCDLGARPADHHTLFLLGTGTAGFNHAAFEVANLDDLMAGHEHLKTFEYTHEWGVGRHILGSQVFDYWRDPWGHTLEHWTDGDLFDASVAANRQSLDTLLGVQWGPPPPPTLGS